MTTEPDWKTLAVTGSLTYKFVNNLSVEVKVGFISTLGDYYELATVPANSNVEKQLDYNTVVTVATEDNSVWVSNAWIVNRQNGAACPQQVVNIDLVNSVVTVTDGTSTA